MNYYALSGLYKFYQINCNLIELFVKHNEMFNNNTKITSVYGNFPHAIWQGECLNWSNFHIESKELYEINLKYYDHRLHYILNCTNTELNENHCYENFDNFILKSLEATQSSSIIAVNSPILYQYLQENYPQFIYIFGRYNEIPIDAESPIPYILNPKHNNNFEELKKCKNKKDVTIVLNPFCDVCEQEDLCLLTENLCQLTFDPNGSKAYNCPKLVKNFNNINCKSFQRYVKKDDINKYNSLGFNHFIFDERFTVEQMINEYLYYLIKDEYKESAYLYLSQPLPF